MEWSREASQRGWHRAQDLKKEHGSINLPLSIWIITLRFTLETFVYFFSLCLQTALLLTTWPGCACDSVPGCGPGCVIHVHEHSWDLHQLPVRPGPAPGLPGDAEVCGGQAAAGDGKPKTGNGGKCLASWLSPSQFLSNAQLLFSPNTAWLASVLSKFASRGSRVWNSSVRYTKRVGLILHTPTTVAHKK